MWTGSVWEVEYMECMHQDTNNQGLGSGDYPPGYQNITLEGYEHEVFRRWDVESMYHHMKMWCMGSGERTQVYGNAECRNWYVEGIHKNMKIWYRASGRHPP